MIVNSIDPIGVAVSTSPPPQVEDPKPCAPGSQFVGEGEHVLGGSSEPVQGGDHEDVAVNQRVKCSVELWTGRPRSRDAVIHVEVVAADTGGQQIRLLPVGGLLPC